MKELPKVYKKPINKRISNNATVYYSTMSNRDELENDSLIDSLFQESGYIFNKALLITTKDKTYDTAIVQKKNGFIYTLSDDVIKISDIIKIERK